MTCLLLQFIDLGFIWIQYICKFSLVYHLIDLDTPTILDKIVGTFSYVFFKVLKNFHNQELTYKTLSVR